MGVTAVDPLVGKLVADRFRVLALVARGGMGRIYRCEQVQLGRPVALKVLSPGEGEVDDDAAFHKRFEREASICSRLNHSNTVRIFDYGRTQDGIYYIAMEFIEGKTLQTLIKAEAPLAPRRVVHILRQIAASLAEAHNQGIVHRDLKPGNVLLTVQGEDHDFVKVVDFGLVKHVMDKEVTRAGLIVGSPMYMAPEQVKGGMVDHRADIYALGMMGYVMVSGKRPLERDTPMATMMARVSNRAPPISELAPDVRVPKALEALVMTALEPSPGGRFASMHEVARALKVCEAELDGAQLGPVPFTVEDGRTILPPEFSDVSLSRARAGSYAAPPPPPPARAGNGMRAPIAIIAVLAVALLSLTSLVALALGLLVTGRFTLSPPAAPTATVAPVGPVPTGVISVEPAEPGPEAPVEPAGSVEPTQAVAPEAPPPAIAKPRAPGRPAASAAPTPSDLPVAPTDLPAAAPAPPETPDAWKARRSDVRNPFAK